MRWLLPTLAATIFGIATPAAAAESQYRATDAVSDDVLEASVATALPGFARDARSLSESSTQLYLQQVGANGRIVMDNWWSQTGAALIFENVLASPAAP